MSALTRNPSIADRMFDGRKATHELENALVEAGVDFEELGFDDYDSSLELFGVSPNTRLSVVTQCLIHDAGFGQVYLNHTDKWETHYTLPLKGHLPVKGWRVSYPHKRGPGEKGIWVEAAPEKWPKEWFETGRAIIKDSAK